MRTDRRGTTWSITLALCSAILIASDALIICGLYLPLDFVDLNILPLTDCKTTHCAGYNFCHSTNFNNLILTTLPNKSQTIIQFTRLMLTHLANRETRKSFFCSNAEWTIMTVIVFNDFHCRFNEEQLPFLTYRILETESMNNLVMVNDECVRYGRSCWMPPTDRFVLVQWVTRTDDNMNSLCFVFVHKATNCVSGFSVSWVRGSEVGLGLHWSAKQLVTVTWDAKRLTALCPGPPRWPGTRKVRLIGIYWR